MGETGLIRPLDAANPADLEAALALSASANWNQVEADWRTMLALGCGWGIDSVAADGRKTLAASVLVLPYEAGAARPFAWISMVLVLPQFQRQGLAQQVLRHAINFLEARGLTPMLDATHAGYAVYAQQGFADTWGFARYRRQRRERSVAMSVHDRSALRLTRALQDSDWPAIDALDTPAFGACRLPLLRTLAQRLPRAARVVEEGGRLCGFVLGRDGREASQIGPLTTEDVSTAASLIDSALRELAGPVQVDLPDRHAHLLPWLQAHGFEFQRPFIRMVHGATGVPAAPGDGERMVLVAGPELG